ncbi:PAS domain-containing protein, partial [Arthrospira platensis SPKY1]|nr:PAS domain-containing protein [Arthrospira platensis SPKY1]
MAIDKNSPILNRGNADFEAFMNHQIGGLLVLRNDGLILGMDEAAAAVFQCSADGVAGKAISDFIPELPIPLSSLGKDSRGFAALLQANGKQRQVGYTLRDGWSTQGQCCFLML